MLLLVLASLVALNGCGTMQAFITTTVHPDLSVSREADLTATGMFANMLANNNASRTQYLPAHRRAEINSRWEGSDYHVTASVDNIPMKEWCEEFEGDTIERDYFVFVSYYRYHSVQELLVWDVVQLVLWWY